MVLESVFQAFGHAVTNPVTYWILAAFLAVAILLVAKIFEFPEKQAALVSIIVSVFLLEFILKAALAQVGVKLDYGSYVIDIPYVFHTTITNGVMIFKFLDFIFNFGLFQNVGIPFYDGFIKTIPLNMFPVVHITTVSGFFNSIFHSPLNFFVFLYVNADGIVDYIFFYYFFYAILVIASDFIGENDAPYYLGIIVGAGGLVAYIFKMPQILVILIFVAAIVLFVIGMMNGVAKTASVYSFGLAAIPLIVYSYYISNPFAEYAEALPMVQKTWYFFGHGSTLALIAYFGTLLVSFILVMQIVVLVITTFSHGMTSTVRPGMQADEWATNFQGVAFEYTLAFALMYALHQYTWYIFFPAAMLYNLFKSGSGVFIGTAKDHMDRMDMQRGIADQVTRSMNGNPKAQHQEVATGVIDNRGTGTNYGLYLIIAAVAGLIGWYFFFA